MSVSAYNSLANDTTKYASHISRIKNPILPVYAGKMGILRVKRDSRIYYKNNDVNNKNNTMPCCVVFDRYNNKLLP